LDSVSDTGTIDKEPSWRQDDHSNASFGKYEYGFDVRSQGKVFSQSRRSTINEEQQAGSQTCVMVETTIRSTKIIQRLTHLKAPFLTSINVSGFRT
jgi:hypothetical protein